MSLRHQIVNSALYFGTPGQVTTVNVECDVRLKHCQFPDGAEAVNTLRCHAVGYLFVLQIVNRYVCHMQCCTV